MKRPSNLFGSKTVRSALGIVALGAGLLVAALATASSAQAQSATCSRLQSQLASLEQRGSKKQRRAFARSIRAQKKQINSVSSKMRGYGCAPRRKLFQREAHSSCRGLRSTLGKMQKNLANLQKGASGGSSSTRRQRNKIKRSMRANLCGARQDGIRRASIMEQIFGGEANRRRRAQADRDRQALTRSKDEQGQRLRNAGQLKNYNTVRTVCVRTCDGYYFPVSFSTDAKGMEGDAQACNNLCPGREMQLYTHKTSTQWADDMVSVATGEPYSTLPKAFAFRKTFNPACACNYRLVERRKQILPKTPKLPQIVENQTRSTGKIGTSHWRDMADKDILMGEWKPQNASSATADMPKPRIEMSQNRRVRIIGESYFPTQ